MADRASLGAATQGEIGAAFESLYCLTVNRDLCRKWAEVSFDAKKRGQPIQTADAWIAASALYYQVPLITNNRDDYSMVRGLALLSA